MSARIRSAVWALVLCVCGSLDAHALEVRIAPGLPNDLAALVQASANVPAADDPDGIETERERLRRLLATFGYLDAAVTADMPQPGGPAGENAEPAFEVVPGPLYRIGLVELRDAEGRALQSFQEIVQPALEKAVGSEARADALTRLEDEIEWALHNAAFPRAEVVAREVARDPLTPTARVTLTFETGPFARFGPLTLTGFRGDATELLGVPPFAQGEPFRQEALDTLWKRLQSAGRFASVNVNVADAPDENGELPIEIAVTERPTVDFGRGIAGGAFGLLLTIAALAVLGLRQVGASAGIVGPRADSFLIVAAGFLLGGAGTLWVTRFLTLAGF